MWAIPATLIQLLRDQAADTPDILAVASHLQAEWNSTNRAPVPASCPRYLQWVRHHSTTSLTLTGVEVLVPGGGPIERDIEFEAI